MAHPEGHSQGPLTWNYKDGIRELSIEAILDAFLYPSLLT